MVMRPFQWSVWQALRTVFIILCKQDDKGRRCQSGQQALCDSPTGGQVTGGFSFAGNGHM